MNSSDTRLGTEPIGRLMLRLSLPAVVGQVINMLYNLVDRIYIGNIPNIGKLALTGVGVTFPIIMIISAFSAFAGMGGAPRASIKMGQGDRDGARRILGNSITLLIAMAAVLTTVFMLIKRPVLLAFGASENTVGYADSYLTIYLCGTLFVQLALGLNTFISIQGKPLIAMLSVAIGAVINIALDPILIFGFDMGVRGAAIATVVSQAISSAWVVGFLISKHSVLRIKFSDLKPSAPILLGTAALGISPFIMQSTESLVQITLNSGLLRYGGDMYVGSMTIILSVMQLIMMPLMGFTQGVQPIMSYNFGAGNRGRVMEAFKKSLTVCMVFTTTCCLLCLLIPGVFARMFTPDAELIDLTSKYMRVFMAGIWAFGAQSACQSTFLALGQARISLFLALLRKVILLVPLALILPYFAGVSGIYIAEPVADILAAATTLTLFSLNFRKILDKTEQAAPES